MRTLLYYGIIIDQEMDAILLIIGITEFSLNQYNNALISYFL
jgi:hypothetical protein